MGTGLALDPGTFPLPTHELPQPGRGKKERDAAHLALAFHFSDGKAEA